MASFLITGCSRGLGLELVKQLLKSPASSVSAVLATSRSPTPSAELAEQIKASENRAHYIPLDVVDEKSLDTAAQKATEILGSKHLDYLINNAGITAFEKDGITNNKTLRSVLETNVIAVDSVIHSFLPLLQQGKEKKIINISSTMGSMSWHNLTKVVPVPSYKISKAALNALTLQWSGALESQGFTVFCLSPGHCQTELGGEGADLTAEQGAKATLDIILNSTKEDQAAFRNVYFEGKPMYDGKNPAW
ncbi:hypothetical protein MMC10_003505 [Thelotrema lepadinum]|nr:hypothetical protein [Thelotrema lepadinum]